MNTDLFDNIPESNSGTPKTVYNTVDSIGGILALVLGYLFVRWIFWTMPYPCEGSAGAFVFTILLIAGSVVYLRIKKIPLSKGSIAFILITFVFSFALIFSSNPFIRNLVTVYVLLSAAYWFCFTCSDAGKNDPFIDDMIVFNMIKAILVMPFSCFGKLFGAFFSNFKKLGSSKKILLIIGGLCIAVIPTFAVTMLLSRADDAFNKIAGELFAKLTMPENIQAEIWAFVIGIPVAMYMFGLIYANSEHKNESVMTREKNERFTQSLRFTPGLVVYTSVTPICLVYVAFFLSQSAYFLSAFSNIIPEGFTYAEYARKGFFELCAVAVINICVIIFISLLTKRESKNPPAMKIYITVISVFTLMMIAIAVSKMVMYIREYGLTPLRIFPTWFMILLAFIFVFIIIRQFSEKFKLFPSIFVAFIIMVGVLAFTDIDYIIADYNIDRYLDGTLDNVDLDMIKYELSDSASSALVKLKNDNRYGSDVKEFLNMKYTQIQQTLSFPNFNFASWRAMNKIT